MADTCNLDQRNGHEARSDAAVPMMVQGWQAESAGASIKGCESKKVKGAEAMAQGGNVANGDEWPALCNGATSVQTVTNGAKVMQNGTSSVYENGPTSQHPADHVAKAPSSSPASPNGHGSWANIMAGPTHLDASSNGRASADPRAGPAPSSDNAASEQLSATIVEDGLSSAAAAPNSRANVPSVLHGEASSTPRLTAKEVVNGLADASVSDPAPLHAASNAVLLAADVGGNNAAVLPKTSGAFPSPTDSASSMMEKRPNDSTDTAACLSASVMQIPSNGAEAAASSSPSEIDTNRTPNGSGRGKNGKSKNKKKDRRQKLDSASSASGSQGGRRNQDGRDSASSSKVRGAGPYQPRQHAHMAGHYAQQQPWNGYGVSDFGAPLQPSAMLPGAQQFAADPRRKDAAYEAHPNMMMMYGMPAMPSMQRNANMVVYMPHAAGVGAGAPYGREWTQNPGSSMYRMPPPIPPPDAMMPRPLGPSEASSASHLPQYAFTDMAADAPAVKACWNGNECTAHARHRCVYHHTHSHEECADFKAGRCPHGRNCHFLHLDWNKAEVCKFFIHGGCRNGDNCPFLHPKEGFVAAQNPPTGAPAPGAAPVVRPPVGYMASFPMAVHAVPYQQSFGMSLDVHAPGPQSTSANGAPSKKGKKEKFGARKPDQGAVRPKGNGKVPSRTENTFPPHGGPPRVLTRDSAPKPAAQDKAPRALEASVEPSSSAAGPTTGGAPADASPTAAALANVGASASPHARDAEDAAAAATPPAPPQDIGPSNAADAESLPIVSPSTDNTASAEASKASASVPSPSTEVRCSEPAPGAGSGKPADTSGTSHDSAAPGIDFGAPSASSAPPSKPPAEASSAAPPRSAWGDSGGLQRVKQPLQITVTLPPPQNTAPHHPPQHATQLPARDSPTNASSAAPTPKTAAPTTPHFNAASSSPYTDAPPRGRRAGLPRNEHRDQECWKMNACKDYLNGVCPFTHVHEPVRCEDFDNGHCAKGKSCMRLHISEHVLCKFHMRGFCEMGDKCRFIHEDPDEECSTNPNPPNRPRLVSARFSSPRHPASPMKAAAPQHAAHAPPANGSRLLSDVLRQNTRPQPVARDARRPAPSGTARASPAASAASTQREKDAAAKRVAQGPVPGRRTDAPFRKPEPPVTQARAAWPALGKSVPDSAPSAAPAQSRWGDSVSVKDKVRAAHPAGADSASHSARTSNGHE